jgi:hypothetical protein
MRQYKQLGYELYEPYVDCYFDVKKHEVIVNELLGSPILLNCSSLRFTYYDEEKCPYSVKDNTNCYVNVDKEQFIAIIEKECKTYFAENPKVNRIQFDCIKAEARKIIKIKEL